MFPHFITSKNVGSMHVVLWQKGHYHYEIDVTGKDGYIQMPDTSFEDAMKRFEEFK